MLASIIKSTLAAGAIISFGAAATLAAHPGPERHDNNGEILVRGTGSIPAAPNNDSNNFWKDYKSDISEAERELASDLRRATDAEDRREAYAEYRNEIRDAKKDYAEEMTERGYRVANFKENRMQYSRR